LLSIGWIPRCYTPAFQFKGTKVKPHMSYASMLLKLQIIGAQEEDKNGFSFWYSITKINYHANPWI
jgi:hypothetical protein